MKKIHIILIIALTFLTYLNSLSGDFIIDDDVVIVFNDFVKSPKNLPLLFSKKYITRPQELLFSPAHYGSFGSGEATYRPVATLSYFLSYALFKDSPLGYRCTNLAIHIINALLVYLLLSILFSNSLFAFFCAILFGIHPINAEVINCTGFRPNSLVLAFSLLAIIFYIYFVKDKARRYYYLSVSSFTLALFSKEVAVFLPFAIFICDYYFSGCSFKKVFARKKYYLIYLLPVVLYALIYFYLMPPSQKIYSLPSLSNISANLVKVLNIFGLYIKDLIFPDQLVYIPPIIRITLLNVIVGVLSVGVFFYLIVRYRRFARELSFGVFWFLLWLLPMNNILSLFRINVAYRYLYVAVMGFFCILGFFLAKMWLVKSRPLIFKITSWRIIVISCIGYFFIFGVVTNFYWKSELNLKLSMAQKYNDSPYAHSYLGRTLLGLNNFEEAIKEFNLAQNGLKNIKNNYELVDTYVGLGQAYLLTKEYAKAEENYLKAQGLVPAMPQVYVELGIYYRYRGLYKEAIAQFNKAKELDPDIVSAYMQSGLAYKLMHKYDDARREFTHVLDIYPGNLNAKFELDNLKAQEKGN